VIGGAQTGRILRDLLVSEDGYESSTVECTFTIQEETVAAFVTACGLAEAAFHTPHADLSIAGLGTKSFSHSSRTGFNAIPSISKFGHPSDSGLSRTYRARVEVGRPADAGSTGRRLTRTSVNVEYGPQRRRTVTISGEWTGISSTTARATYESQIVSYASSVTTSLGGTYKLLSEPQTAHDDANNVIRISIVYEEILFTSVGGADSDIRNESVILMRTDSQPGDTAVGGTAVIRLGTISVQYSAHVEKATTDIKGRWTSMKTRLLALARTTYDLGGVIIVDESPNFDFTGNQFTASMTLTGLPGNKVVECRATTEYDFDEGIVLVPIWNGDKFGRYQYQGPATEIKTITIQQQVIGRQLRIKEFPDSFADPDAANGKFILKRTTYSAVPIKIGGARGNTSQELTALTETKVYERAKVVGPAANNDVASGSAFSGSSGTSADSGTPYHDSIGGGGF
jgi:hypothetical protein